MRNDIKVLILKNRAMGDSILTLSSVQYFKKLFPKSYIYFGVPKWVAPIFNSSKGAFDEVLPLELNSLPDYTDLFKFILNKKITVVIELFPRGSSQKFFKLISSISTVRYIYRDYHQLGLPERQGPIIQKDLDTIFQIINDKSPRPICTDYPPSLVPKNRITSNQTRVIFGVVASRETKMWPLENYVELASYIKSNFDVEIIAPLSSSKMDNQIADRLSELDLDHSITIKRIALADLSKEFYKASLYIGNDTGLKHLCIALGVRTFSFFGPEPPKEWHPYKESEHKYFYIDDLGCRTERNYFCDLSSCDSMICLNRISVNSVFEKIKEYLP